MTGGPARPLQRWILLGVWGAALGLNGAVFADRLSSLIRSYRLFITEGGEGPHVYAIWRVLHGLPLYEWPDRPPFSLTFYNFLFYRTYAWLLSLGHVDGEGLLAGGRWVTFLIAIVACATYSRFAWQLVPKAGRTREAALFLALYAPVLWLGSNFTSWWAVSIRPDVTAAFLAILGLWIVSRYLTEGSLALLGASVVFWLAWAFKQSVVLTFGGVVVFLLLERRSWRAALSLIAPFTVLASLTLAAGSPQLRYNLLVAPTAAGFSWIQVARISGRVLVQNSFVWVPALILGIVLLVRRFDPESQPAEAEGRAVDHLLITVAILALAGGLLLLGREASNKNHMMEAYFACGLVSARWLLSSWERPAVASRRATLAAIALSVPMAAFPGVQLAWPNRFGITRLASATQYAAKVALAEHLVTLPKPVLIVDDVLAQPWHATGGRYPTVVLDPVWVDVAMRHGTLPSNWIDLMLAEGGFEAAVLRRDSPYHRAAIASRYRCDSPVLCPRCGSDLLECRREPPGARH